MHKIIPFKAEHLAPLLDQSINQDVKAVFLGGFADHLETIGGSATGLVDGKVAVCGGVWKYWENRGQIWTVFNQDYKDNFLPVFRILKEFLDQSNYDRLEMSVPFGFEIGKRRAKLLGFTLECERARKYLPNGVDCALFARVK